MKKIVFISLVILSLLTACHNQDWEFDDYDYTTVYFAYQTPVRTIVLGDDIYDNSLDNEHKCTIYATMGGVYENTEDRILDVVVDNSLCDNLYFSETGKSVTPMPDNYYTLPQDGSSQQITIESGSMVGGLEVQLSDAFFADEDAISNTYVIPLKIEYVQNADSVLQGVAAVEDPNSAIAEDWETVPKDYILYCVKYINALDAYYLRRGQDVVVATNGDNTLNTTNIYHEDYVESDELVSIETISLYEASISLTTQNGGSDVDIPYVLNLNFEDMDNITVSGPSSATYSVSGSGEYVTDGDEWGDTERDVIHLSYTVEFASTLHTFNDTLVIRDRDISLETFTPTE